MFFLYIILPMVRKIIETRESSGKITLEEFSAIFMAQKKNDVANMFKTSIKEAKGLINKRNNEIEVEHLGEDK